MLLDIYDVVKNSKAPVTGIVYRRANSMASVILQACKVRKAMSSCEIIIHNSRIKMAWDKLEENLDKALKGIKIQQKVIYEIYSKRTGMSMNAVKKRCKKGKTIYAQEAKEIGLVDEVI